MKTPTIVRIHAQDISILMDVPLTFLKNLQSVIDMSEFNYDSTDPEEVKLFNFLNEELYPFLEGTIQGIEEQN